MSWPVPESGDPANVVKSVPLQDDDVGAEDLEKRIKRDRHNQDLGLRDRYAGSVLWISVGQIIGINVFFALDAIGSIPGTSLPFKVSDDLFKVFAISVFAAVIAVFYGVTRSLFPGEGLWASIVDFFHRGAD